MRKLTLLVAPLVLASLGCTRFAGPVETRHMERADALGPDGRPYTLQEQEARGRQRYTIPDNDFKSGPPVYSGIVDPTSTIYPPLGR